MRIVRLSASNFKRLYAVAAELKDGVVKVTGRNSQGKSSVLDAIQAALGGKKASPEKPIRSGADQAEVIIETEEFNVVKKWTARGETLIVEAKNGARFPSPQAFLDKLGTAGLGFDPLAFSRMAAKEQASLLRRLVGLDTSELDGKRARLYDERTRLNAEHKTLEANWKSIPMPDPPCGEVGTEISIESLIVEREGAFATKTLNDSKRSHLAMLTRRHELAETRLKQAEQDLAEAAEAKAEAERVAADLVDPDVTVISAKIDEAKEHNATVQLRRRLAERHELAKTQKAEGEKRVAAKKSEADGVTTKIAEIDAQKQRLLAEAKFPIPGMSVEGDQVLINGVPFSQASSSEQIRVGLAMGAALNPKLRVILVRDGSLLDQESLRIVEEWANSNSVQVFMECVTDGEVGDGIVIEDGSIKTKPVAAAG